MSQFWDERFSSDEYVYGTEPNSYFKDELSKLTPGKLLLPGEGEGRNAVYAAKQGWQVTAFDTSSEGKKKAEKLAQTNNVAFDYLLESYDSVHLEKDSFDCIALIYTHMNPEQRHAYHQKLLTFLKPGGTLILEGFCKEQINNNTGGPKDVNMLFSKKELETDFATLSQIVIDKQVLRLNEGNFHHGEAAVIRLIGNK